MRYIRLVAAGVSILLVAYVAVLTFRATHSGLSWKEMDFDRDGRTSIGEFLEAGDVGTREVRRNGRACTEYFLLKDGRTVKVSCPAGNER
jgi:hypothetical protein